MCYTSFSNSKVLTRLTANESSDRLARLCNDNFVILSCMNFIQNIPCRAYIHVANVRYVKNNVNLA